MLSPDSQRKKKSLKPKTISDDPKYINEYQTSTIFFSFIYYLFFCVEQPKQVECHTSTVQPKEPQIPNTNGLLKLKLLDQNLRVERKMWQAWLVALRRECVTITQEKIEAKWIRCEDAKRRRKETSNDAKKEQTKNNTMLPMLTDLINKYKAHRGKPPPRSKKVCKAEWKKRP